MAKQAGGEDLNKKEDQRDANGQGYIHLREHVAEAGEHDDEKAGDDAAGQQAWKLKRKDQREEIDAERKNPQKRDGGDIGGQIAGYGAQLHGRAHGQQDPKELVGKGRGSDLRFVRLFLDRKSTRLKSSHLGI